jgi:glycosyltransferase involved in cell wall biosynthesis
VKKLRTHRERNHRLFWLENTSDEYLEKIYAAGTCLMAASEAEGFGLPLIEASRYNLPIIARDIPVFREVAGAHAFYFDGSTAEALAGAVQTWMERNAAGKAPRSDSMPCLTWAQSTRRLMKAILPSFKGDVLSDG